MERKYSSYEEALAVAKEVVWLAWNASHLSGYGFMQDRGPNQDREKVWDHAYHRRDYAGGHTGGAGSVDCDYVMGRMMKLHFTIDGAALTSISDSTPRSDYQSWCGKYKTYADLFNAAEAQVLPKSQAA